MRLLAAAPYLGAGLMMRNQFFAVLAIAGVGGAIATPAAAQESLLDRLSIHGYMTQGYGKASVPIYGLPVDGTADLRTAALQLRYAISPQDDIVLQARNRRLGDNILSEAEEDVQLQWAFYQRRMNSFSVRIGKVPLPMGFYSEVRNVGTIIPFFRAPATVYPDGVETFDGVNLNYDLALGSWAVEASSNFGSFGMDVVYADEQGDVVVNRFRGDMKYNGTLTVNTPLTGLRLRGTFSKWEQASFFVPDERDEMGYLIGSVDGSFTRFNVRSEFARLDLGHGFQMDLGYAQAGVRLHPRITVNAQYEVSKFEMEIPFMGKIEQTSLEDYAVGANYALSPNVVLKLEGHRARGFVFDNQQFGSPRQQGNYMISSLSVSF
jgi:hypothetical protein